MSPVENMLLAVLGAPALVGLLAMVARASVNGHASQYAKDVEKVHGGRPRPMPHQEVSR